MRYLGPVKYVASFGTEMMWLIAGIIVGMILMAVIDFMIDRLSKPKIELTVYRTKEDKTIIFEGDRREDVG